MRYVEEQEEKVAALLFAGTWPAREVGLFGHVPGRNIWLQETPAAIVRTSPANYPHVWRQLCISATRKDLAGREMLSKGKTQEKPMAAGWVRKVAEFGWSELMAARRRELAAQPQPDVAMYGRIEEDLP